MNVWICIFCLDNIWYVMGSLKKESKLYIEKKIPIKVDILKSGSEIECMVWGSRRLEEYDKKGYKKHARSRLEWGNENATSNQIRCLSSAFKTLPLTKKQATTILSVKFAERNISLVFREYFKNHVGVLATMFTPLFR